MGASSPTDAGSDARLIAGRYAIEAELGRGGMGSVFRTRDRATGKLVALKTLDHADPRLVAFFEREYQTLASIRHPRVIEVYDFGIADDGRRFYTMALIGGSDLGSLTRLPVAEVCAHLRDVATCLLLLHARRLVHRDVSPRNIRLDEHGRAHLLDFGALCGFGVASELVGTPQCIAPEALLGQPLDQRADIFALGVVGYWALTGEAPYAARRLTEVASAHLRPPTPLAQQRPDVPRPLEQLVMAMLSVDPLERPANAAEILERLSAITGSDDAPLEVVAEAHLQSPVLLGRERESEQLRQSLQRAAAGAGAVVVVEGAPGMGASRVVAALELDARLLGTTPLHLDAAAAHGPQGVLRSLVQVLLQSAPAEARETLRRFAGVLTAAFPDSVGAVAVDVPRAVLPRDPLERRTLVQNTVAAWLQAVCARRSILLVVDELQRVDAASAGALIALAHAASRTRLLIVGTQPSDEARPHALGQLVHMGARIKLRGLDAPAMERLVTTVFGDVPHTVRLAQWLQRTTGGNPGQAFLLLKDLVARGIVRYEGGAFALPAELNELALPRSLEDSVAGRMARLSPVALELARLLALYHGSLTLTELCLCARAASDEAVREALEQLLARDVLSHDELGYRFGHELLRRALLSRLDPDTERTLHRGLADALMAARKPVFDALRAERAAELSTPELGMALQTAGYMLKGGELVSARQIMSASAIALAVRGEGFAEAVPALEAALKVYRAAGVPDNETTSLVVPLTLAGTYHDYRLGYRYGDEVLQLLCEVTGVALAARLARFLPRPVALWLSLVYASVRYVVAGERRRFGHTFRIALLGVIGLGSAIIGAAIVLEDKERARQVAERLRPLAWFPARHPARIVRTFQESMVVYCEGDLSRARALALEALAGLRAGKGGMPAEARLQLEVGILSMTGPIHVLRTDGSSHGDVALLEQLPSAVSRQVSEGILAAYHGHRGERAAALAHQERLDVLAAQVGSTWRHDVGVPRLMWSSYVLSEDVMGLKRCLRTLETWAKEAPTLERTRDVVHACYLSERGFHAEALARFAPVLEAARAEPGLVSARIVGAYARILRMAGRAEQALEVATRKLAELGVEERAFTMAVIGLQLEQSLARSRLGAHVRAADELDTLLAGQACHDNPLVRGLVHKARAMVALDAGDAAAFASQLRATEGWFRRARNPALAAQLQRFSEEARARGLEPDSADVARGQAAGPASLPQVQLAFDASRGPAERLQVAIDLVLAASGAEQAYLYLMEPQGLRFVAPSVGAEPPESLRRELEASLLASAAGGAAPAVEEFRTETLVADAEQLAALAGRPAGYRSVLLTLRRQGRDIAVGAFALVEGEQPARTLAPAYLEALAHGIYAAGDVHTVYLGQLAPDNENAGA